MNYHDEDYAPEPAYDPWDWVDAALDAGLDPVWAHDVARSAALEWHLAVSGQSRVDYLREYENRRPKRKRTDYWREYKRRRRAMSTQPSSERDYARPKSEAA